MLLIGSALALYLTIYVWRRVDRPLTPTYDPRGDFTFFYTAAKAMTLGQDIYTAQPPGRERAGYIYPPLLAFLYQPLAKMNEVWAARGSLLINIAAIAAALGFTGRAILERFRKDVRWPLVLTIAVLAAILSLDKIKGELQMLQTNALVACAIALGLWLLDRRPFWAGAAIAFAINVKYQALALLVYMLLRRRWKPAAATLFWIAIWAILPAISVGWTRDMDYLVRASSGLLRLVGINTGGEANIEPLSSGFSVSITSGAARILERLHSDISPYLVAGAIAILWLALVAWFYRTWKCPILAWPDAKRQEQSELRPMVAVEWVAVLACVLAFSPQTSPRHMVQTLAINVLGVVLASETRGRLRFLSIVGLVILWCGMNLPPGHYDDTGERQIIWWRVIGGAGLSVIVAMAFLVWTGLGASRRDSAQPQPAPAPVSTAI
jgi:hypothetical protein